MYNTRLPPLVKTGSIPPTRPLHLGACPGSSQRTNLPRRYWTWKSGGRYLPTIRARPATSRIYTKERNTIHQRQRTQASQEFERRQPLHIKDNEHKQAKNSRDDSHYMSQAGTNNTV